MKRGINIVYAFFDEQDRPFYVGRTNDLARRRRRHKNETLKGNKLYKYNKLRKVLKVGLPLEKIIRTVESGVSNRQIRGREQYWVAEFIRQGYKLTNLTEGGSGGFRWTKECREAYGKRKRALGLRHSLETRQKMSAAKKGKKFTAEHRRKLSIARRKRVTTQETREKMRRSMKGKRNIKLFQVISPEGEFYTTTEGLTLFCEQHNLTPANMVRVANGERPHHKGWRCVRLSSRKTSKGEN
jgi:hypothetical protein